MTVIRLYLAKLHRYAGVRLYVNLLGMIAFGFMDAAGIYLLVPLLGIIGLVDADLDRIPFASELLDALKETPAGYSLPVALAAYVAIIACQSLLQRGQQIQSVRIQQGFIRHLRLGIYEGLMSSKWIFFVRRRKSDIHHLLTSELARVSQGTYLSLQLASSLLFTIIQLSLAFWLSPELTVAVLVSGSAFALMMRRKVRDAKGIGQQTTELSLSYYAGINDHFGGIKDIKSNRLESSYMDGFRELTGRMEANFIAFARLQGTTQWLYKSAAAVLIALFVYLSFEVFRVSANQLMIVVLLFARLWPRFASIQNGVEQIFAAMPAFRSLMQLEADCKAAKEPAAVEGGKKAAVTQAIECRDVDFRYDPDRPEYALRGVSVRIPAGSMTAIVGKSGAGKSTLADMLMGLLEPERGVVAIDGVPLTPDKRPQLRHAIGYVSQNPFLFHASIRDNLMIVRPDADEGELWEALRFSASETFVAGLPDGLDTIVGDRGENLSGGERQRIVLARAMLRRPTILVLDEATSALDAENEAVIGQALETLRGKVTIIVIAHRLTTIRRADQVIVMDQGKVIVQERGQRAAKQPQPSR